MAQQEMGSALAGVSDNAWAGSVFFSQPLVIKTHEDEEMNREEVAWKREE